MPTYKTREALFKDSRTKSDEDWHNWIATLLVNPKTITDTLYHISFKDNLPKTITPQPVFATGGAEHVLYNERLPPRLSTSTSVLGCWQGIYANFSEMFERDVEKHKLITIFVYEVTPHADALILTDKTATHEWLLYDAHLTKEHSVFGGCDLKLLGEVVLENSTHAPDEEWTTFHPYGLKKYNMLYSNPPFVIAKSTLPNTVTLESFNLTTEQPMSDITESKIHAANLPHLEAISLEAIGNPFSAITDSIKRNLHNVIMNLQDYQSDKYQSNLAEAYMKFKENAGNKTLKKSNHIEVKDIMVVVPTGFTGDYIAYTKLLGGQFRTMQNLTGDVLEPAHNLILKYIGKPETMSSVSNDDLKRIRFHDKEIESFKKSMNKFFDAKKKHQALPVGKLVRSGKEFNNLATELGNTVLPWMLNTKWQNEVFRSYTSLQQSIDLLLVRIEQKPQEYQLNKLNAERLAKMVNDVAVEVELTSAMFVYVNQLVECAIALQETLIKNAE